MITGHSERRVGFGEGGESSELVAEKTKVCACTSYIEEAWLVDPGAVRLVEAQAQVGLMPQLVAGTTCRGV